MEVSWSCCERQGQSLDSQNHKVERTKRQQRATYVSVLTISAFSLERYLAICHPLHLYAMAGLTRATKIIVVLWLVALVSASPYAHYSDIYYRDYPPNSGNVSLDSAFCTLTASSPLLEISSIFFFFIPAVIILCLYITMGIHIRSTKVSAKAKQGMFKGHVHGESRQAKSRKAVIRMLIAVVIAFFVCWTPFHVQRLFFIYGYNHPDFHVINEHLFNVAGALYYVSATVNPILYNVMSARYRLAFRETLLCRHQPDRNSFDRIRRETTLSTCARPKSSFYSEQRLPTSKVDFVKDKPFCIETEIDDKTIFYYPNVNNALQDNHDNGGPS
nr:neuropeptides capa receptor-like [Danaus plexippus plexippus]